MRNPQRSFTIAWRDWDMSSDFAEKSFVSKDGKHGKGTTSVVPPMLGGMRLQPLRFALRQFSGGSMRKVLLFLWIAVCLVPAYGQEGSFDGKSWWNHIKVLAADDMEGRDTGSPRA